MKHYYSSCYNSLSPLIIFWNALNFIFCLSCLILNFFKERRHRSNTEVQLQGATTDLEQARKALDERIGKAQRFDSVMDERNRLVIIYHNIMILCKPWSVHIVESETTDWTRNTPVWSRKIHFWKLNSNHLVKNCWN